MRSIRSFALVARASLLVCAFITATGCASNALASRQKSDGLPQQSIDAIRAIEEEILEANSDLSSSSQDGTIRITKIPIEINENVRKWIHYFTVKDRARFQRYLDRGAEYKPLIQGILKDNDVPTELYYLALIESGFSLHARSHASAVGAWQFIRDTGRRYGLMQTSYIDERREIIHSTHAAARYLKNLHTAFQSWYLAMASYNAGEGRILGAILRGGTRDFWELVENKALPPETRNYVPKFIAATIIGKHPERYGFTVPNVKPYPAVKEAKVPGGVRLSTIARQSGIPLSTLKHLNPHLRRGMTPVHVKTYAIWVPKDTAQKVAALAPKLAREKAKRAPASRRTVAKTRYHRVRRGETLGQIARKYHVSLSSLKRTNRLKSNQIQAGRKLRIAHASKAAAKRARYHKVRRGDALARIADRYNTSVSRIKKLNDLDSSRIYAGQKLRIDSI